MVHGWTVVVYSYTHIVVDLGEQFVGNAGTVDFEEPDVAKLKFRSETDKRGDVLKLHAREADIERAS